MVVALDTWYQGNIRGGGSVPSHQRAVDQQGHRTPYHAQIVCNLRTGPPLL